MHGFVHGFVHETLGFGAPALSRAQVTVARSVLVIISLLSDPPPGTPTSATATTGLHRHRPQAAQPHPANPSARSRRHHTPGPPNLHTALTRSDHRTGPGPLPRPFTVGNFSGQQLVTGLCTLAA